MIFWRKSKTEDASIPMKVQRVRFLSVLALIAYPVGAVTNLIGSINEWVPVELTGFLLIFIALFAFVGIVGTGVQRIAGEESAQLDPVELELRQKTYARAYHYVGAVFLLAILYLGIATDSQDSFGLWVPSSFDHWSAIMWGAILLVMVLPTALLSWSLPKEEIMDDGA